MKYKLEVGMYVRTIKGIISKIVSNDRIARNTNKEMLLIENFNGVLTKDVIKTSYDIIDIIEVGDYVNGSKVVDISIIGKDKEKWVWVEQMEDTDNKYGDDYVGYNNEQIKSIVTKEQFSQMEYKVEQ